jgi:tRNA A-37 threonylcarbamoyl transferase component Bud32
MIAFPCTGCGRTVKAPETLGGRQVRCPGCAQILRVPVAAPLPAGLDANATLDDLAALPDSTPVGDPTPSNFDNATATVSPDGAPTVPTFTFLARPQAPDELGRLAGHRILQLLGRGGMGLVFLAEELALNRRVAMKVMLPEIAAMPQARERFRREAKAVAALANDHVVSVYHVGEDNGVPYLTMPLLQGETLETRLRRETTLPVGEVLRIGCQIAEGLAAAHDARLIHRDVKPANVWLEAPQDRVKLLDFGLARGVSDARITQSGVVVGTPAYMAPEQVGGTEIDQRADLFSLGCVLYEMSTGRRPFEGENTLTVLANLAITKPPLPHAVNYEVPVRLSALVMWLLSKKAEGRPSSTIEVLKRLRKLEEEASRAGPAPVAALPAEEVLDALPADDAVVRIRPVEPPWWAERPMEPSVLREPPPSQPRRSFPIWLLLAIVLVGALIVLGPVFYLLLMAIAAW